MNLNKKKIPPCIQMETIEESFHVLLEECVMSANPEIKDAIALYLKELTEIEKIAILIAKEHLETSFDISKSVGFRDWLNSKK